MTTRSTFLSINALFRTDKRYDEVLAYKQTGALPAGAKRTFASNYAPFEVRGGKLYYKPANLQVIRKSDVEPLLARLYADKTIGPGKGAGGLYSYVCLHYCNISRNEVETFIRREPGYILAQPRPDRVNKPFSAKRTNELWCVDLIDLNPYLHNQRLLGYRYIMTVIDVFSRRVFLGMLKDKTAKATTAAFKAILRRADTKPKRLLADNGLEFQGQFSAMLQTEGIAESHSRTHAPQSNGLVERANLTVRTVMKSLFIKNRELNWTTELPTIERNINASFHSAIKNSPNALWNARNDKEPAAVTKRAIAAAAAVNSAKMEAYKAHEYKVGDHVRVLMSSLFSGVRARIKAGDKKAIVVQFDPTIYVVSRVMRPRKNGLGKQQYALKTLDGNELRVGNGNTEKLFFASELSSADVDKEANMTQSEALRLDGAKRVPNNDVYVFGEGLYFDDI